MYGSVVRRYMPTTQYAGVKSRRAFGIVRGVVQVGLNGEVAKGTACDITAWLCQATKAFLIIINTFNDGTKSTKATKFNSANTA